MTYEPVMASRRNNRGLRIALIVVGVVVALCCVGSAVGGYFVYGTVKETVGPVSEATTSYLDAVRAGDHQRAYGQLCRERRGRTSLVEFTRQQEAQPRVVGYEVGGVNVTNTNGRVRGSATVRLTTETGSTSTQVFSLVKEDGAWRICG
ncbi:Rv0361 family membrane protein [Micromonospora coxensis]|uniref:Rv0361 family membrane protein n=1 Tax=Micromonospora coxensis TaxID=356852 RepID=UPI00343F26C6